jgi:succinylglutamate desuccinylase
VLTVLQHVPDGFLECSARSVQRVLPNPTLIHLPGRRKNPLFVSTLLHGNEDTGLQALQQVLAKHRGRTLPRALSLFIGNVSAAAAGLRRFDAQPDYNRVWPGADSSGTPEHLMMRSIVDSMYERRVFASIDIHNNTGTNPLYACVNVLGHQFLHLATLFSRTVVHYTRPKGVQSAAMALLCPAVTVECGKPGNQAGAARAAELVEAALHLDHFPSHPVPTQDIDLYHTIGIARVPKDVSFAFGDQKADLNFDPELDRLNFRDLAAGTRLARTTASRALPLEVLDEAGDDVAARFLERQGTELRLKRSVTPAMLTLDERAIRLDCMCYFMERTAVPAPTAELTAKKKGGLSRP